MLFIPIISANTQAREEGYFRLEWDLAAERARTIASGVAFILPVVIDDTREPVALVPDRFRTVQWTRLPGGSVSPDVLARFLKLWSHRAGVLKHEAMEAGRPPPSEPFDVAQERQRGGGTPPPPKPGWKTYAGLVAAIFALVAAVGWWTLRRPGPVAPIPPGSAVGDTRLSTTAVVPLTEARQLAQRARAVFEATTVVRQDMELAEQLVQKAEALDSTDAYVWAVAAQVDAGYVLFAYDTSETRAGQALSKAERALKMAPESFESRLAKAFVLTYAYISDSSLSSEARRLTESLLKEQPDNRRVLLMQGQLLEQEGRWNEAVGFYRKAHDRWAEGWCLLYAGRFSEVESVAESGFKAGQDNPDRQAGAGDIRQALMLLFSLNLRAREDLAAAQAVMDRMPPNELHEDETACYAADLRLMHNQPEKVLEIMRGVPRDWLVPRGGEGPYKATYSAFALQLANHPDAAKVMWQAALKLVEERLAARPNAPGLVLWKAFLLARLGERTEATRLLQLYEQLQGRKSGGIGFDTIDTYLALGRREEVIAALPGLMTNPFVLFWQHAYLRFDPRYDSLRGDPQFEKFLRDTRPSGAKPFADQVSTVSDQRSASGNLKPQTPDLAPSNPPAVDSKSVAVLAFANLSDDKANEYFSDGISEELLNVLAKVPMLKVAARTSSFYFKGRNEPIPEIAQKLGVAYVVEGSVRKAGNKVRITAQLIKAADGFHVWSETYDRDLTDIFAVQDEIAKNILGVVKGSLLGEAELPHTTTTKIEAYTLFLQGQGAFGRRGVAGLEEAIRLFEAALAVDPDYVPALVGLAQARVLVPIYANLSGAKAAAMTASGRKAAQRALELDPRNATAHVVLGWAMVQVDWRWSDGLEQMLRARELAPNDAWIWNSLGDYYRFVGDLRQALAAKRREWELDPLSSVSHWDFAYTYLVAGDYDQTIHWCELAIALAPHNLDSYMPAIFIAAQTGRLEKMRALLTAVRREVHENEGMLLLLEARGAIAEHKPDEARRILAQVVPLAESGDSTPAYLGYLHLLLGESDQAAHWLQLAYERHDAAITWPENIDFDVIAANPKTRPILDQPGLKELYELRQRNARAGLNKL